MKIISISGIDGSGKSTQAQLLITDLTKKKKRVLYFHAVSFSIANKLLTRKKTTEKTPPTEKNTHITKASFFSIFLRKCALFIDVIRFYFFILINKNKYDYLITDRYFYDMIINIAYLEQKHWIPFYFSLIHSPHVRIFLHISPKKIMSRQYPPEQGIEYLIKKNNLFHYYKNTFHLIEVNGNQSKQKIFSIISSHIS